MPLTAWLYLKNDKAYSYACDDGEVIRNCTHFTAVNDIEENDFETFRMVLSQSYSNFCWSCTIPSDLKSICPNGIGCKVKTFID